MSPLIFGVDRDVAAVGEAFERSKSGTLKSNPMRVVYGSGPADKLCRDCAHLRDHGRYAKCDLRRMSSSAVTDHRKTWPTCGKFEPDKREGTAR